MMAIGPGRVGLLVSHTHFVIHFCKKNQWSGRGVGKTGYRYFVIPNEVNLALIKSRQNRKEMSRGKRARLVF